MDRELMKGSIDILVLHALSHIDMYGYEIAKTIKEKSQNLYRMSEGTLYPALKRMETKGLLVSYWSDAETGGRRKYYRITESGKTELAKKLSAWQDVFRIIKLCTEGTI